MDKEDRMFLDSTLSSGYGANKKADADSLLLTAATKEAFNFDRATEVYKFVIDDAVHKGLGSLGRLNKRLLPDPIRWEYARELAQAFGRACGIRENQRPTRRGISALFFGK